MRVKLSLHSVVACLVSVTISLNVLVADGAEHGQLDARGETHEVVLSRGRAIKVGRDFD